MPEPKKGNAWIAVFLVLLAAGLFTGAVFFYIKHDRWPAPADALRLFSK